MNAPDIEAILAPGERILWRGRPDRAVHLLAGNYVMIACGIGSVIAGISLLILVPMFLWYMKALVWAFLTIGILLILQGIFMDTLRRRKTYYFLSDRRAFIAMPLSLGKPRLKHWPIGVSTVLEYDKATLSTIYFHEEERGSYQGRYKVKHGFMLIRDGDAAYRVMRDIQGGKFLRDVQNGV